MNIKKVKAFTLIELIITITILSILGTISFFSIQGYSKAARDSVRISNYANIDTTLGIYNIKNGKYPEPENYSLITYSGSEIWKQGVLGSTIKDRIGFYGNTNDEYFGNNELTYSIIENATIYEIGGLLEGVELSFNQLFLEANAAQKKAVAHIKGNYNGRYLKTIIGLKTNIIAIPSLILNTKGSNEEIIVGVSIDKFVIGNTKTLPGSFSGTLTDTDVFNFTPELLYKGNDCSPSTDIDYYNFEKKLRNIYGTGVFKNLGNYSEYKSDIDVNSLEKNAKLTGIKNNCKNIEYVKSDIFPLSCLNEDGTFEGVDNGFNIANSCLFVQNGDDNWIVGDTTGNNGSKGLSNSSGKSTTLVYNVTTSKTGKFNFDFKTNIVNSLSYVKFYIQNVSTGGGYQEFGYYIDGGVEELGFTTFTSPLLPAGEYNFKWLVNKYDVWDSYIYLDNLRFTCIGGGNTCGWADFNQGYGFEKGALNPWDVFNFLGSITSPWIQDGINKTEGLYSIMSPDTSNYKTSILETKNINLTSSQKFNFDFKTDMGGSSIVYFYIDDILYEKFTSDDPSNLGFITYTTPLLNTGDHVFKWVLDTSHSTGRMWLDNFRFTCVGGGGTCGWTDFTLDNGLEEGPVNPWDMFNFLGDSTGVWLQDGVNKTEGLYSIISPNYRTYKTSILETKNINLTSPQKFNFDFKTEMGGSSIVYFYIDDILYEKFTSDDPSNLGFITYTTPLLNTGDHVFKWVLSTSHSTGRMWLDNFRFTCVGGGGTCGWTDFTLDNGLEEGSVNPWNVFNFLGSVTAPWKQDGVNKTEGLYSIMSPNYRSYQNIVLETKSINLTSSQSINFDFRTEMGGASTLYFYIDDNLTETYTSDSLSNTGFVTYTSPLLNTGTHVFKWTLNTSHSTGRMWLDNFIFTP